KVRKYRVSSVERVGRGSRVAGRKRANEASAAVLPDGSRRTIMRGCQAQLSQSIGTVISVICFFWVGGIGRRVGAGLVRIVDGYGERLFAPVTNQVSLGTDFDFDPKI